MLAFLLVNLALLILMANGMYYDKFFVCLHMIAPLQPFTFASTLSRLMRPGTRPCATFWPPTRSRGGLSLAAQSWSFIGTSPVLVLHRYVTAAAGRVHGLLATAAASVCTALSVSHRCLQHVQQSAAPLPHSTCMPRPGTRTSYCCVLPNSAGLDSSDW